MFSKKMSRSVVSVLGFLFVLSLCIGLPGAIAEVEPVPCDPESDDDCIFGCTDDADFTMDFRLKDCWFKTRGINPFFKLIPGYRVVLEGDGEKSVETVLCDTKWIKLGRRWIKTRVVEERALELDDDRIGKLQHDQWGIVLTKEWVRWRIESPFTEDMLLYPELNYRQHPKDSIAEPDLRLGDLYLDMTKEQVLEILGQPDEIFYRGQQYTLDNLPGEYCMAYPDYGVLIENNKVFENLLFFSIV